MSENAIRLPLWTGMRGSELLTALSEPPNRYRPVPWLAWTGSLEWPGLEQQLLEMLDKGITEFFLFPIYGMEFPQVTTRDMVRVQKRLLDELGVKRLQLVIGGSLGGMQVWQWLVDFPDFVEAGVPIAGTPQGSPWMIALNCSSGLKELYLKLWKSFGVILSKKR